MKKIILCFVFIFMGSFIYGFGGGVVDDLMKIIIGKGGKNVGKEVLENGVSKYGDDFVKAVSKYGDDAVEITNNYGDDGIKILSEYGDDGYRLIKNYGDDSIEMLAKNSSKSKDIIKLSEKYNGVIDGKQFIEYGDDIIKLDKNLGKKGVMSTMEAIKIAGMEKEKSNIMKVMSENGDKIFNFIKKNKGGIFTVVGAAAIYQVITTPELLEKALTPVNKLIDSVTTIITHPAIITFIIVMLILLFGKFIFNRICLVYNYLLKKIKQKENKTDVKKENTN